MSGDTLLIEKLPGETRAARLRRGVLWQVEQYRDSSPSRLGAVYLGRVRRVDAGVNAAFVDLGEGADGFLRARDAAVGQKDDRRAARIGDTVQEGQALAVRIVADGYGEKGPRIARADIDVPSGASAPSNLEPAPEPIARILSGHAAQASGLSEILCSNRAAANAALAWAEANEPELAPRIGVGGPGLFDEQDIDGEIAAALARRVSLSNGVELVFDTVESLCAIDINSAAHTGKAGRGARDVNRAAMPEIARQLRLRNIAGAIVIDALRMGRGNDRRDVLEALRRALKDDPANCHVLGVSNLGLIEVTRTRTGPSLAEAMLDPEAEPLLRADAAALLALRRLQAAARAQGAGAYTLRAAPAVIACLQGPLAAAFKEAALTIGAVDLAAEPGWPRDRAEIVLG